MRYLSEDFPKAAIRFDEENSIFRTTLRTLDVLFPKGPVEVLSARLKTSRYDRKSETNVVRRCVKILLSYRFCKNI